MGFEFKAKHCVRDTEHYRCEIDEFVNELGQRFFQAHVDFIKFTPAIAKQFFREFEHFRQQCPIPLWALGAVDDDKWAKFVSRLGFHFQMNVVCNNGAHRRLFYCPPPGNSNAHFTKPTVYYQPEQHG